MQDKPDIFVITSTINSHIGLIDPATRFSQTIETITSIKSHVANCVILLIDNSIQPLTPMQLQIIKSNTDYFLYVGDRRQVIDINRNGIKGAGEAHMLLTAFDFITTNGIVGSRIFKLSGRYKLSSEFDIKIYHTDQMHNKYVFKTRDYHQTTAENPAYDDCFLHTRMWSFDYSLLPHTVNLIKTAWLQLMTDCITIEQSIYRNMHLDKLIELDKIHVEGFIAPWNTLIKD